MLGVGGPAGFNVASAAKAAGYPVIGVDSNAEHLLWADSVCMSVLQHDSVPESVVEAEILVFPQPERLVLECAERPDVVFHGPSADVVAQTQDKAVLTDNLPIFDPIPDHLCLARDAFGLPFWLRARHGAGARGALKVDDLRAAYHWIRLHEVLGRDFEWIAEPFLPGRDFCWTGLFHQGTLIAAFARERLEWLFPHLTLSGRTGTPTISETVHDRDVSLRAVAAVAEVDPAPNGVYCVDLRCNEAGDPVVTEINAGRYATTSPLYRYLGVNLVELHIKLALGEKVEPLGENVYPAGKRLMRHIDMGMLIA